MNLVFIDIEACNFKYKASICNIGVIVTDAFLNVLETRNIYINPETSFRLPKSIDIGLTAGDLADKPTFDKIYPFLSSYLNNDNIVIGHAMSNDSLMLNAMCERYNLPFFQYRFLCCQMMYAALSDNYLRGISLSDLAAHYQINFESHRAIEDTKATMLAFKAMLEEEKLSISQFLEKYHISYGQAGEKILPTISMIQQLKQVNRKIIKLLQKQNLPTKEIEQFNEKDLLAFSIKENEKIYLNKHFTFNKGLEKRYPLFPALLYVITLLGGQYHKNIQKTDIYISANNSKYDKRKKAITNPITVIREKEFIASIQLYLDKILSLFSALPAID